MLPKLWIYEYEYNITTNWSLQCERSLQNVHSLKRKNANVSIFGWMLELFDILNNAFQWTRFWEMEVRCWSRNKKKIYMYFSSIEHSLSMCIHWVQTVVQHRFTIKARKRSAQVGSMFSANNIFFMAPNPNTCIWCLILYWNYSTITLKRRSRCCIICLSILFGNS